MWGSARPANLGILFVREGDLLVCINFLSFFDMHWAAGMHLLFVSCGLHYVGTVYRVRQCCMRFLVLSSSGPALISLLMWLDVGKILSLSLCGHCITIEFIDWHFNQ